jgi:FtsP/CotA-like multicopper oxidase with cupredoxin domain
MAYRPFPAGPLTPVDGLQMAGRRVTLRYALALAAGHDDPYALADDVLLPLEVVASLGGGTRPASGTALSVEGAQVSAVRRERGVLEVRVFNPTADTATVSIAGHAGWLINLRGRPVQPFEGSFELRPFGIATARLRTD